MKIDLKKQLSDLYGASARAPVIVDVPPMSFLMVDGKGDPNTSEEYRDAVQALYSLSYTLKFAVKKGKLGIDYGVMPLEGLWWVEDMSRFTMTDKGAWSWTAMIMQPEYVTSDLFAQALAEAAKKKDIPSLSRVRFASFHEGRCAQVMHIGPYASEEPNIVRLHNFIKDGGHSRRGKHHEIYLSDPQRTAPERLKTIIRQPLA